MPVLPNGTLNTSAIGVGCAYLTAGSPTFHDARLIWAALDEGARHFDVAPQYGLGTAEAVLGRALQGCRNKVTIATKVGIARPVVHPLHLTLRAVASPLRKILRRRLNIEMKPSRTLSFDVAFAESSVRESLRHLRTDRVDTLLLHMPAPGDLSEELVEYLVRLRQRGTALSIGLATYKEFADTIVTEWPNVFDVIQYAWNGLEPSTQDSGMMFRITYRPIVGAIMQIKEWVENDPHARENLSRAMNCDVREDGVLSRALLGASLLNNPHGITLVGSRSIARTRRNIKDALNRESLVLGASMRSALGAMGRL